MANIWVVKGPNGDMYYPANRTADKMRACDKALEIVLANVGEVWASETVLALERFKLSQRWDLIQNELIECGAMRCARLEG